MGKTYEEIKGGVYTFTSAVNILDGIAKTAINPENKGQGIDKLSHVLIPAIALKAFTCELALKSLAAKSGKEVKNEHKLNKLYAMLPDNNKRCISTKVISEMKTSNESYNDSDFLMDLDKAADLFRKWRYFYEKNVSANLTFIDVLYKQLISIIQTLE